jgi:hypothetical protein
MKLLLVVAISLILITMPGCNPSQEDSNEPGQGEPEPLEVLFPNGAPALGQTAELIIVFRSSMPFKNVSIEIDLPDAFELVSGELYWFGDIPNVGDEITEIEVIRAEIKAVEVGNWTIEYLRTMNPAEQYHVTLYPNWQPLFYVSVSEDSAEWGKYPPWYEGGYPVEEQED